MHLCVVLVSLDSVKRAVKISGILGHLVTLNK